MTVDKYTKVMLTVIAVALSIIAIRGTGKNIFFNSFVFHFSLSFSGFFVHLNHFLDNFCDVLNLQDFIILQV